MSMVISGTSGVTFPDASTQAVAAGAPTTAQVLSATAAASAGAVGTYAFCGSTNGTSISIGSTVAGSTLRYSSINGIWTNNSNQGQPAQGFFSGTPSGTWRCMGYAINADGTSGYSPRYGQTLWLRIS